MCKANNPAVRILAKEKKEKRSPLLQPPALRTHVLATIADLRLIPAWIPHRQMCPLGPGLLTPRQDERVDYQLLWLFCYFLLPVDGSFVLGSWYISLGPGDGKGTTKCLNLCDFLQPGWYFFPPDVLSTVKGLILSAAWETSESKGIPWGHIPWGHPAAEIQVLAHGHCLRVSHIQSQDTLSKGDPEALWCYP